MANLDFPGPGGTLIINVNSGFGGANDTLTLVAGQTLISALRDGDNLLVTVQQADNSFSTLTVLNQFTGSNNKGFNDIIAPDGVTSLVDLTALNAAEPEFTALADDTVNEGETATSIDATTGVSGGATFTPTYSLAGLDAGLFSINSSTGAITFNGPPNFEDPLDNGGNNVYDLIVIAQDGFVGVQEAVTVTVDNVDPTITSANTASVDENTTFVIDVDTDDPVGGDGDVLFSFVAGANDNALFSLDANTGELTFTAAPDAETPLDGDTNNIYIVEVQADDGTGAPATQTISVTVNDVNEAPVVSLNSFSLDEGASEDLSNHLSATDEDATDGPAELTYTIDSAPTNGTITLNGAALGAGDMFTQADLDAGLVFYAHNDSETTSDSLGVTVRDDDGLSDSTSTSIHINAVEEAPTITSSNAETVEENFDGNILTVTATDPEMTPITFSIDAGFEDGALFRLAGGNGDRLRFDNTSPQFFLPDFDNPADGNMDNEYIVRVVATDGAGETDTQDITVTVTDLADEADEIVEFLGGGDVTVNANDFDNSNGPINAVQIPDTLTPVFFNLDSDGTDLIIRFDDGSTLIILNQFDGFASDPNFDPVFGELIQVDGNGDPVGGAIPLTDGSRGGALDENLDPRFSAGDSGLGANEPDAVDDDYSYTPPASPAAITIIENFAGAIFNANVVGRPGEPIPDVLNGFERDEDGDPVLYSLDNDLGDNSLFTINAVTGELSFTNAPNFEDMSRATATEGVQGTPGSVIPFVPVVATTDNVITFNNEYKVFITADDGRNEADSSVILEIDITVTDDETEAPEVTGDLQLEVAEGGVVTVMMDDLDATADVFNVIGPDMLAEAPERIIYTVEAPQTGDNGLVALNGVELNPGETFTQADLDAGLVTYIHDGSDTSVGQFRVTVRAEEEVDNPNVDGLPGFGFVNVGLPDTEVNGDPDIGVTPIIQVNVAVSPVNDAPVVVSALALQVVEENAAPNDPLASVDKMANVIGMANLFATDSEDDAAMIPLDFELVTPPTTGTLYRNDNTDMGGMAITDPLDINFAINPGLLVPLAMGDTFTAEQVANGQIFFVHDGSEPANPSGGPGGLPDDGFTVQVTDSGGATDQATVQINVAPVNDLPSFAVDPLAFSVPENTTGTIQTIMVVDPDAGSSATYNISGGVDAALFTIDATTGELSFIAPPNFEDPQDGGPFPMDNVYELTVRGRTRETDADGNAVGGFQNAFQNILVTVTDENDAPEPDDDQFVMGEDPVGGSEGIPIAQILANDTQEDDDEDPLGTPNGDIDPSSFMLRPLIDGLQATDLVELTQPISSIVGPVLVTPTGEIRDATNTPVGTVVGSVSAPASPAVNASVLVSPNLDYNGNAIFGYKVADGGGAFGEAVVGVEVFPTPDAPVALDNTYTGEEHSVRPGPDFGTIDLPPGAINPDAGIVPGVGPFDPLETGRGANAGLFANVISGLQFTGGSAAALGGGLFDVMPTGELLDLNGDPVSVGADTDADSNTPDDGDDTTSEDNSDIRIIQIEVLPGGATLVDPVGDPAEVGRLFQVQDANGNTARVLIDEEGDLRIDQLGDFNGALNMRYTVADGFDAGGAPLANALTDTALITFTLNSVNDDPDSVSLQMVMFHEDETNTAPGVGANLLAVADAENPDQAEETLSLSPPMGGVPADAVAVSIFGPNPILIDPLTIAFTVDAAGNLVLGTGQFDELAEGEDLTVRFDATYTDGRSFDTNGDPITAVATTDILIKGEDDAITANVVTAGEIPAGGGLPAGMDVIHENDVVTFDLSDLGIFNTLAEDVDSPAAGMLPPSQYDISFAGTTEDPMNAGVFLGDGIEYDSNTGLLTFTPDGVPSLNNLPANTNAPFQLDFTLTDDTGGPGDGDVSNVGSIIWTVNGQNDAPIFDPPYGDGSEPDVFNINENSTGSLGTISAMDPDGETITYSLLGGNVGGIDYLGIDTSTGEVSVITPLDFEGTKAPASISFRVIATDGTDTVQSDQLRVDAADVDDAPHVTNLTLTDTAGQPVTINQLAAFLAANVSDQDGEAFNLVSVGNATGGTVALNFTVTGNPGDDPNDNILFTPTDALTRTGTFEYTVREDSDVDPITGLPIIPPGFLATDLESTGTITINFTGVTNVAPVGEDDEFTTDQDTAVSGNVLADNGNGPDSDANGDALTVDPTPVTGPTNGSVVLNANGDFTYTPNAGFGGTDTFTYTVFDAFLGSSTATVTIEVTPDPIGQTFFGDQNLNIFNGTVGLIDTVDYSSAGSPANAISVFLNGPDGAFNQASGGQGASPASEQDIFVSIENVIGTIGDDVISGSSEDIDNIFWGGMGSDALEGGGGDDQLFGEGGNDVLGGAVGSNTLDGGTGLDTLNLFAATTGIVFDMNTVLDANGDGTFGTNTLVSIEGIVGAWVASNTLIGNGEDNRLVGGNQADVLVGNGGSDLILGFGGDDDITGGAGIDVLNGGTGADTFFIFANSGIDLIQDFEDGTDLIDISGTGLGFGDLTIAQAGANVNVTAATVPGLMIMLENQNVGDIDSFDFV